MTFTKEEISVPNLPDHFMPILQFKYHDKHFLVVEDMRHIPNGWMWVYELETGFGDRIVGLLRGNITPRPTTEAGIIVSATRMVERWFLW